jgi:hypothetical protein
MELSLAMQLDEVIPPQRLLEPPSFAIDHHASHLDVQDADFTQQVADASTVRDTHYQAVQAYARGSG